MNRTKTITLTIGSMAAGAIIATGLTGVALAADTTPSPSSTATVPDSAGSAADGLRRGPGGPGGMHGDRGPGGELLHSESVVKAADGTISTEQRIRGTVTAVSASSITVKAEDGVSVTFAVSATTGVHTGLMTRGQGADATEGTVADVKVDDVAMVEGTVSGSTTTATRIHAMTAAEAAQMEQERAVMEAERGQGDQGGRGMAPHAHDAQGNDIPAAGTSATGTSSTSAA